MRLLALAPLALLLACSGAASTELFGPTDGTSDDSITEKTPSATLPAAPSSSASTPTTSDPTPPTEAPTPTTPPTPPEDPPNETCAIEIEPNDTQNQATSFDRCLAGQIGSRQDVDWGTFTAPKTAKTVSWTTEGGDVTVRVSTGGLVDLFPVTNGGPIQPGSTLFVRIGAVSGKPAYAIHFKYN